MAPRRMQLLHAICLLCLHKVGATNLAAGIPIRHGSRWVLDNVLPGLILDDASISSHFAELTGITHPVACCAQNGANPLRMLPSICRTSKTSHVPTRKLADYGNNLLLSECARTLHHGIQHSHGVRLEHAAVHQGLPLQQ